MAPTFRRKKPADANVLQTLGSSEHNKILSMLSPDPLPYQPKMFKSSTVTKLMDIPRRHPDPFNPSQGGLLGKQKGLILHSHRYAWENMTRADKLSQRDRMLAEEEEVERARNLMRYREMLNYRTKFDLLLGGERLMPQRFVEPDREGIMEPSPALPPPRPTAVIPPPLTTKRPLQSQYSAPQLTSHSSNNNAYHNPPPFLGSREEDSTSPISMGVRKVKLLGRSTMSSQDILGGGGNDHEHGKHAPGNGHSGAFEDWGYLPKIPFPYYPSMAASVTSSADWNQYLLRQQHNLRDVLATEPRAGGVVGGAPLTEEEIGRIGTSQHTLIQSYVMDGNRATMNERANIMEELRFLKSIVLPDIAKDLYVGRGIKLPPSHITVNPRQQTFQPFKRIEVMTSQPMQISAKNGAKLNVDYASTHDSSEMDLTGKESSLQQLISTDSHITEATTAEDHPGLQELIDQFAQLDSLEAKMALLDQFKSQIISPIMPTGQKTLIQWIYEMAAHGDALLPSLTPLIRALQETLPNLPASVLDAMESVQHFPDSASPVLQLVREHITSTNGDSSSTFKCSEIVSKLTPLHPNDDNGIAWLGGNDEESLINFTQFLFYLPYIVAHYST